MKRIFILFALIAMVLPFNNYAYADEGDIVFEIEDFIAGKDGKNYPFMADVAPYTYLVTLSDLSDPPNTEFKFLFLSITTSTELIDSLGGPGHFTFAATPGERYFVNVFGVGAGDINTGKFRVEIEAVSMKPSLEDTMHPAGAVHAHDNLLWPPNNKLVKVRITGYVMDELSMVRDEDGIGVSRAYLLVNGRKIILRDEKTDLLNPDGSFHIVEGLWAKKNAIYPIKLFAADTSADEEGLPNFGLVDSTFVRVPHDMSGKTKDKDDKKKKKSKKKKSKKKKSNRKYR